jgi:hypothetical protein
LKIFLSLSDFALSRFHGLLQIKQSAATIQHLRVKRILFGDQLSALLLDSFLLFVKTILLETDSLFVALYSVLLGTKLSSMRLNDLLEGLERESLTLCHCSEILSRNPGHVDTEVTELDPPLGKFEGHAAGHSIHALQIQTLSVGVAYRHRCRAVPCLFVGLTEGERHQRSGLTGPLLVIDIVTQVIDPLGQLLTGVRDKRHGMKNEKLKAKARFALTKEERPGKRKTRNKK